MHFSLVVISPRPAWTYNPYDDAILPMYFALKHLGFNVEVIINKVNPNSCNIIFGSVFVAKEIDSYLPKNSIIYNLEQMTPNGFLNAKHYISHLSNFEVWDYSEINVKALQDKNINATYSPLGYVPEMSRLERKKEPDLELFFYGTVSDCREPLFHLAKKSDLKIHIEKGVHGVKRDELICRSKAVLNLHTFYTPVRLEEARLGYLWANKIPIISEIRHNTSMPDHLKEACFFVPYDAIVEEAKSFLSDNKRVIQQGNVGFLAFSSKPLETSLKLLVGKKIHSVANAANNIDEKKYVTLLIPSLLPYKKKLTFSEKLSKRKVSLKNSLKKRMELLKNIFFYKILYPFSSCSQKYYNNPEAKEWLISKDIN